MVENKVFQQFGLEIFNTNLHSGLRAFAHVPLEVAMKDTLSEMPQEPFDLKDWYVK
jgi:hypothetical protein